MSILSQVKQLGQQIWLDNLSRSLVQNGMLAQMLEQGVCGVTSNPAIFQKAFAGDPLYTPEIETLKKQGKTAKEIYETLAVADVQAACDAPNSTAAAANQVSSAWKYRPNSAATARVRLPKPAACGQQSAVQTP